MKETQQRIQAYEKALPALKERVFAVALLLVVSLTMLTSASFAWYTLSQAPEVKGASTTVAANGNLEIALVEPDGVLPGASRVGDSSAAEDQTIVASNLTWGNLINLTDPSYGLENISLRPALLSDYNLERYPLYGAAYGRDGRVTTTADRYEYASWTSTSDGTKYFAAGDAAKYGVRAIASVKYENMTANATFTELWGEAMTAYGNASSLYMTMLTDNKERKYISALEGLLSVFVQDKVNSMAGNSGVYTNCGPYLESIHKMLLEFQDVLEFEGKALLNLANLQAYLYLSRTNSSAPTNTFADLDALLNASDAMLEENGVVLESLETYVSNLEDLADCIENIGGYADLVANDASYQVYWTNISESVNKLVDVSTATLNDMVVSTLGRDDLIGLLSAVFGRSNTVVIYEGILKDTEQRLGTCMGDEEVMGKDISVSIKVDASKLVFFLGTIPVTASVQTDAAAPFTSTIDKQYTEQLNDGNFQGGDAVARETYGMAIDLWVRTNSPDVILTLEGSLKYENEPAFGYNSNNERVNLYILKINNIEYDVYCQTAEDNTVTWYYADSHQPVEESVLTGNEPTQKFNKVVVGYQGENRIWEDWEAMLQAGLIQADSTTQGAGSCYVFYADGPSERAKILDLLGAFTVAFVDGEGNRLATAMLDTEHTYDINGKVTVPLELISGVEYEDDLGNVYYGITSLERNEATRITAIVYLNGYHLENQNVLATGQVRGQMNIQFGSSTSLTNPEDDELQSKYFSIAASAVAGEQTSVVETAPIQFAYDGTAKSVTVTLTVSGDQPDHIEGFFLRAINSTQGSSGESKRFSKNDDGTWSATFNFTTPGNYVLNSVFVDGIEYTFSSRPAVKVDGFNISHVQSSLSGVVMTADSYVDVTVRVKFDSPVDLLPSRVRAQFRSGDNKEHNTTLTYDAENQWWTGTVRIDSSDTYTLEYLILDGEYVELTPSQKITITAYLGMTTRIYNLGHVLDFPYTGEETVRIQAKIWDDSNTEMKELTGVKLYYHMEGSGLDQNGMMAELEWNPTTGFYDGEFEIKWPGTFRFNRLTVTNINGGTSTITTVVDAPSYRAYSLVPPTYTANATADYQFAPNQDAVFSVRIADSNTAKVWAALEDQNGNTVTVEGSGIKDSAGAGTSDYIWSFDIPYEGDWELTELYLQNVFVNDVWYSSTEEAPTAENSYVMALTDGPVKAYVVHNVNVTITKNGAAYQGEALGGTKDSPTGKFMQEHTVSGVTVTVTDWNGRPIEGSGISVTWTITYDSSKSEEYGGYTGASLSPKDVEMNSSGTANVFVAPDQTFRYAGEYNTSVKVSVADTAVTVTAVGPKITVASAVPTVTITAITPEEGVAIAVDATEEEQIADTTTSTRGAQNGDTGGCNPSPKYDYTWVCTTHGAHKAASTNLYIPSITDNGRTATVYFACSHPLDSGESYDGGTSNGTESSPGTPSNIKYHDYLYIGGNGVPSATLRLSGLGEGASARLTFTAEGGGDVMLFTEYTADRSGGTYWADRDNDMVNYYEWTADDSQIKRFVGGMDNNGGDWTNTETNDEKYPAGTITASTLVVSYDMDGDGRMETFNFTIPTITIHNPY